MITNLDQDFKERIIRNRLEHLSRQYFELELDKVQAQANGLVEDAARATDRMMQLENAYAAIEALLPTTTV